MSFPQMSATPVPSAQPIPQWQGVVLMLLIASAFASNHVAARVAFDHGANVLTAVLFRSAGTALAVLALMRFSGVPLRIATGSRLRAIGVGLALAIQSVCLYSAVARIPAALALLVFNVFPLLLVLISWLTGAGRPSRRVLVVMPIALVGLTLALDVGGWSGVRPQGFSGRWAEIGAGVAFALVAAVSFALALLLSNRWLGNLDGRMRSFATMSTVALLALGVGLGNDGFAWPHDMTGWLALTLLTAFYGIAFTSLFALLPRLGTVNNAALMNFEPIAVLFLAWAILGQSVAPLQIFGALVVIGAVAALASGKR